MISLKISGYDFDPILRQIDLIAHPDLTPLANELGEIAVEGNRIGLLAGTDAFGDRMDDVEESTIRRGRGGDGPPLVPRNEGSRAIKDFRYRLEPAPDRTLVILEWPGTPFIHFQATGFVVNRRDGTQKPVVPRDPVGIRPETVTLFAEAAERFALRLVGGP